MGDPRYIHRVLKIEADTEEERQMGRAHVAASMADVLAHVTEGALIKKAQPHPALYEWEKFQRRHITQHMRKPQNMRSILPPMSRSASESRLSLQLCDVVQAWFALVQYRQSKAYRQHQEKKRQLERQAKLERRRQRERERMQGVAPRVQTKKQVVHEEVERCEKCHKRPAVRDHLCGPCLDWERAKLGRG